MTTLSATRATLAAFLACAALGACDDDPGGTGPAPIASGTIGGYAFTVVQGTILRDPDSGILIADASGGTIVFDDGPAGLGMSDPDLLQLRTLFALSDGGSLHIAAFGTPGSELSSGLWVVLERNGTAIDYDFRLAGASFADSAFSPPPAVASGEQWVVTEFYADSVPGYPAGQSGIAMWELNDLTPSLGEDVLRCDPGPAVDAATPSGDRVALALVSAFLVDVEFVDQIVGPCV